MNERCATALIEWVEPGEHDQPIIFICSESEAIDRQRSIAASRGYTYESDDAALQDFITVNWARRVLLDAQVVLKAGT